MKNYFIIWFSLLMFVMPISTLSESQKRDWARLNKVIQELEDELARVTTLRDCYLKSWAPRILPWGYEMILNEYRIKVIKNIYHFKKQLAEFEANE